MPDSRFVEICMPKAAEFLEARHDPATIVALKIKVHAQRRRETRRLDLARWRKRLNDPAYHGEAGNAKEEIARIELEAELDEDTEGVSNAR